MSDILLFPTGGKHKTSFKYEYTAACDGLLTVSGALKSTKGHWHIWATVNDVERGRFMLLHELCVRPIDKANHPVSSGCFGVAMKKDETCTVSGSANEPDVLEDQVSFAVRFRPGYPRPSKNVCSPLLGASCYTVSDPDDSKRPVSWIISGNTTDVHKWPEVKCGVPIMIALDQVYELDSIDIWFYDADARTYDYYIDVSSDANIWVRVIERHGVRSWEKNMRFDTTPVKYIRITGTKNTMNPSFHPLFLAAYHSQNEVDKNETLRAMMALQEARWAALMADKTRNEDEMERKIEQAQRLYEEEKVKAAAKESMLSELNAHYARTMAELEDEKSNKVEAMNRAIEDAMAKAAELEIMRETHEQLLARSEELEAENAVLQVTLANKAEQERAIEEAHNKAMENLKMSQDEVSALKEELSKKPTSYEVKEVAVYENERRQLFSDKYNKKYLMITDRKPWTTEEGDASTEPSKYPLPQGWEWFGDWNISNWKYAFDFPMIWVDNHSKAKTFVRRRRHGRKMRRALSC